MASEWRLIRQTEGISKRRAKMRVRAGTEHEQTVGGSIGRKRNKHGRKGVRREWF